MLNTFHQSDCVLLNQLQENVCETDTDLKQRLGTRKLEVKFWVCWPNQVEVLRSDSRDELLTVQCWLVKVENEQQQGHDVFYDGPLFEVLSGGLQVALQQVQQGREKIDVVLVSLETLYHFFDQDDHKLRDALEYLLVDHLQLVSLAVEGVEAQCDETTDLILTEVREQ